jgi:hypothetical protein
VGGKGHIVTSGNNNSITTVNNTATPAKKGLSFDTKMLFAALIADVVLFFYGMWSYTGKNTSAEGWRAVVFLVMIGLTIGMLRRWLRRGS